MVFKKEFIAYLKNEKRYSHHTIISYENDLNQFHKFSVESGSQNEKIDSKLVRLWVVSLLESDLSARTIHRKLSSLRSYCNYLIKQGELNLNPLDRVLKPKLSKRIPAFIEEEKLNHFLEDYDFGNDFTGLRNKLIIELLYQTGMRRGELMDLEPGSLSVSDKNVRVLGKRGKERIIPVGEQIMELWQMYLKKRQESFSDAGNKLFLTVSNKPVYPRLIYKVVNDYLKLVTTLEKKSPHVLRHTFATHLLNKGADLNAIKELLGHSSLGTTQIYTHNTFEKLREVYNKAHPRA